MAVAGGVLIGKLLGFRVDAGLAGIDQPKLERELFHWAALDLSISGDFEGYCVGMPHSPPSSIQRMSAGKF